MPFSTSVSTHAKVTTAGWSRALATAAGVLIGVACSPAAQDVERPADTTNNSPSGEPAVGRTPEYGFQVVNKYPHDTTAFTQGLVYVDGSLYEGTGQEGHSLVRRVALESGEVLQQKKLPDQFFGEGIAVVGDVLVQLTYKAGTGFVYDRHSLVVQSSFTYAGEGWGLTSDGRKLIMSDGTDQLRFLDPTTFLEVGRVSVYDQTGPVRRLNELEYVAGEVYANVWQTDRIVRISPQTGQVVGLIDLGGLLTPEDRTGTEDVLNGIAYDAVGGRLFVTGKWWAKLYEIVLTEKTD
jgi:glutamine cyclotransferase